jgi:hypothetical protein
MGVLWDSFTLLYMENIVLKMQIMFVIYVVILEKLGK